MIMNYLVFVVAVSVAVVAVILIINYVKGKLEEIPNYEIPDYSLAELILLPECEVEKTTKFVDGKLYQTTNYYCYECRFDVSKPIREHQVSYWTWSCVPYLSDSLAELILQPECEVEKTTKFVDGKLYQTTNYYCYECIYQETLQVPFQYKGKTFNHITNYGDDRNAICINGKNFIIVGRRLVNTKEEEIK